jgi:hypothetical protein
MHNRQSWKLQRECCVLKNVLNILYLCYGFFFIVYAVFIFIKGINRLGPIVYTNSGALVLSYITLYTYTNMEKSKYLSSTVRSRTLRTVFLPLFAQMPCWLYMLTAVLSYLLCRGLYRSVDWFWPELLSLCVSNLLISFFSIPVWRANTVPAYFILLMIITIPLTQKNLSVYALPWWTRSTVPSLFVCTALIVLTAVLSLVTAAYAYKKR